MSELRQGPASQLWQALIVDGAARRCVPLDEQEESYLGFVLIRHMRDASLASRVLAIDWLDAVAERGTLRGDALRDVGDRCLLIAGLYPQLAGHRRVTPAYYAALGRDAYGAVARATRSSYAALFAQLALAFDRLVEVLRALRADAGPRLLVRPPEAPRPGVLARPRRPSLQ